MAGHVITRYLESLEKYYVINCSRSKLNKKTIKINVFNPKLVNKILIAKRPDVVINCIGILVKESNENPDRAIYVNSYFPHLLEKWGRELNFKLIHLSTDCVFSGKKGNYLENDLPDASDFYGRSKALGEIINDKDLTFRTSIIGPELKINGTGLFHWFLTQKDFIYGYCNVFWTGITTLELAKAIDKAIEQDLISLYHLVPNQKISKYQLLNLINEIWNLKIKILEDFSHQSDKSLVNTRNDFKYEIPSYREMLIELYNWMKNWKYEHYSKLLDF